MSFKTIKQLAVSIFLSSAACFAVAVPVTVTYDLGTLNTTLGQSVNQFSGEFDDIFKFIAGTQPNVLGSMVGLDMTGNMRLDYRFGSGSKPSWGAFTSFSSIPQDPDTGSFFLNATASGLVQGETYWINLAGSAEQASYSLTLVPMQVPEPGSLALTLLALGMVGVAMRRRKNNDLGA